MAACRRVPMFARSTTPAMRNLLLPFIRRSLGAGGLLLFIVACGTGEEPPAGATGRTARDWSDDDMWAVLEAQDHRDRPALLGFLKDERPEIRERAALAFASSPDSLALPALINALGDADPLVPIHGGEVLSPWSGEMEYRPPLTEALSRLYAVYPA